MNHGGARAFADDWIEGFNSRDLERIMSHYADDVTLISPAYLRFTEGRTDLVRGKAELRTFFATALERFPDLHFDALEVAAGSRGLCIRYHTSLGNQIVMECFEFDGEGSVVRSASHYAAA